MGIQQLIWQIERLRDSFHQAVFVDRDLDAAVAALADDCVLTNVPAGTGAHGIDGLCHHLAQDVLPHLPADLTFRRITRTADQRRLVEETMVGFTHDRELPWLLPGAAPTHRHAEVLAMSVVVVRHTTRLGTTTSLITEHRTLWDHTGLLAQLGLDAGLPSRPIVRSG